ncbi:MAG TPA: hypothetical protein VK766_08430 [Cytophagaceae bacterium]|jgi:hypothetical protein|nr:hypothetical protein [Cytophagaceae bacterium]
MIVKITSGILLLFVLVSCDSKPLSNVDLYSQEKKVILSDSNSFNIYWEVFSTSVIKGDKKMLSELVADTLEVIGREDTDPIIYLPKDKACSYIIYLINNGGFYDEKMDSSVSYIDYLRSEIKDPYLIMKSKKSNFFSDFVFLRTISSWELKFVYADTKNFRERR